MVIQGFNNVSSVRSKQYLEFNLMSQYMVHRYSFVRMYGYLSLS